ncbi:MAG: hypothetical protein ACRED3_05370 [Bradyrhizobium sp.]
MGNNRWVKAAVAAVVMAGLGSSLAQPASAQSITDRFKGLFGGKSDEPAPNAPKIEQDTGDLTCPDVRIRAGASTYAVGAPGKQPVGNDLRFQATINKTARECNLNGGVITARIGIQGRVIAGPAGAPATVQVPLRVAVVQGGINEKTIATKAYQTTVNMTENGSEPFTLVAEDLVYPAPSGAANDSYIFYIGFDPQALKPERPPPKAPKKKTAAPTE